VTGKGRTRQSAEEAARGRLPDILKVRHVNRSAYRLDSIDSTFRDP
jgi:hypothetical protein